MKLSPLLLRAQARSGFSYLAILIPVLVLGGGLGVYLKLVAGQNYASMRSQSWNLSLVMAESGVEEAMAHLNSVKDTNFSVNGWTHTGSTIKKRTYINTNQYYDVIIHYTNWMYPTIIATGNVPSVVNF